MTTCYLAGPMTGKHNHGFDVFKDGATKLRGIGWTVISPAEMDIRLGFDPTAGGPEFACIPPGAMKRDLNAVTAEDTDTLAMLPGWHESVGTLKELRTAIWSDLRIVLVTPESYPDHWWIIDATSFAAELLEDAEQRMKEKQLPSTPVEEVRMVSETGGAKGRKDARFGLIPTEAMWEVARCYGIGAEKYDDWNWALGYNYSLSIDALERHLNLWKGGEQIDEAGFHHLSAVVFHALTLMDRELHAPEFDDRRDIYRNDGS